MQFGSDCLNFSHKKDGEINKCHQLKKKRKLVKKFKSFLTVSDEVTRRKERGAEEGR